MLIIDEQGYIINPNIMRAISHNIEKKAMTKIRGVIIHQTGGSSAQSTLNAYSRRNASGAHFLIDKDGTIYQTASVFQQTWHVGKLRARCLAEYRCFPTEFQKLRRMSPTARHRHEMKKQVPDRYPSNKDSIGIELVGQAFPLKEPDPDKRTYETATIHQNAWLSWLIRELTFSLGVPITEIFRHPAVSQKNVTEAGTARW